MLSPVINCTKLLLTFLLLLLSAINCLCCQLLQSDINCCKLISKATSFNCYKLLSAQPTKTFLINCHKTVQNHVVPAVCYKQLIIVLSGGSQLRFPILHPGLQLLLRLRGQGGTGRRKHGRILLDQLAGRTGPDCHLHRRWERLQCWRQIWGGSQVPGRC